MSPICVTVLITALVTAEATRLARLRNGKMSLGAPVGTSSGPSSSLAQRFELDLTNLHLMQSSTKQHTASSTNKSSQANQGLLAFTLVNTTLNGTEIACLNCNPDLFSKWIRSQWSTGDDCKEDKHVPTSEALGHGKHPNAPGYDEWANKQAQLAASTSMLSVDEGSPAPMGVNFTSCVQPHLTMTDLYAWDVESIRPRLQTLWATRRLVMGMGANPLHQQMDFASALESLARKAPLLTPSDCAEDVPHCNALMSGSHKLASGNDLRAVLKKHFNTKFLHDHTYQASWNITEQRRHTQAILTELKSKYTFYHQKCLAHEPGDAKCNKQAASELVGRIACRPEDDTIADDCMFAELRICRDCGNSSKFFEYARFHGPMALFDTSSDRHGVMGQCEEFSRAAHALFAALGYEVRYVLDFTDHVWVEVQLPKGKDGKWLHADPSEGVLDSPLMYEKGWGKQLTMIFAFTPSTVEHVTSTYTESYLATVARRGIPEYQLNDVISEVNERLKYEMSMKSWGYTFVGSKDRELSDVALWSHFEAN